MLGTHVIAVCENCTNKDTLSAREMELLLIELATQTGFNIVKIASHQFKNPDAATVTAILTQSHLTIHTWPEYNKATLDLFSCGAQKNIDDLLKLFSQKTGGKQVFIKTHTY